jgi:hypothetical protein
MAVTAKKPATAIRKKRTKKPVPMTKAEMVQKMFADQKIIREAIQNGTDLKELEKPHGLKFAALPPVKD